MAKREYCRKLNRGKGVPFHGGGKGNLEDLPLWNWRVLDSGIDLGDSLGSRQDRRCQRTGGSELQHFATIDHAHCSNLLY
jgi:hypothetical protein